MNKFIPMGWNHNPSDWAERVVALVFVLTGFGIAVYLALFQLGFLASVWEPIFGEGANRVLHSPLTRKLAVPDAALGALGYLLEAVLIAAGSNKRWRDQPWIVTLYGLVAASIGAVSLFLIAYQTVFLRAWCTLCLGSAVISIGLMIPAADEFLATLQFLKRNSSRNEFSWRTFLGLKSERAPVSNKTTNYRGS
ncbi:MAG TPA: vitamin K epoxide reductase family protein [Candidatus Binatia bacterium]